MDFGKVFGKALRLLGKGLAVLAKWVYEEATGNDWPGTEANGEIILTIEEVHRLIELFGKYLYVLPVLVKYEPNAKGALWIKLKAIGYLEHLKDLPVEQLKAIAIHIVQSFYLEVRGFTPPVYILSISPQGLTFAIPLSEEGRKYLEKVTQMIREQEKIQEAAEPEALSEEIPPLEEDPTEDKDDPRV
ncbi:hypothetical protein [Catenibacillus scindens]|nr:hypothetical protein [Catenibacillus scindens]